MQRRRIQLLREGFAGRPAFDAAVSSASLRRVAEGSEPETLRLYRPDRVVAFGRKDALCRGYPRAVQAAHDQGFATIARLAGGRAAVFHETTLAFAWAIPDREPRQNIQMRFHELASIVCEAFRALGVDARIGEVPGEYCPGAHSVNARGERKLMGVAQRVLLRASHVGGVVVVANAERVRAVLEPVYAALELPWSPETTGSLQDEVGSITLEEAEKVLLEAFARRHELTPAAIPAPTLLRAERLCADHVAVSGSEDQLEQAGKGQPAGATQHEAE